MEILTKNKHQIFKICEKYYYIITYQCDYMLFDILQGVLRNIFQFKGECKKASAKRQVSTFVTRLLSSSWRSLEINHQKKTIEKPPVGV